MNQRTAFLFIVFVLLATWVQFYNGQEALAELESVVVHDHAVLQQRQAALKAQEVAAADRLHRLDALDDKLSKLLGESQATVAEAQRNIADAQKTMGEAQENMDEFARNAVEWTANRHALRVQLSACRLQVAIANFSRPQTPDPSAT